MPSGGVFHQVSSPRVIDAVERDTPHGNRSTTDVAFTSIGNRPRCRCRLDLRYAGIRGPREIRGNRDGDDAGARIRNAGDVVATKDIPRHAAHQPALSGRGVKMLAARRYSKRRTAPRLL